MRSVHLAVATSALLATAISAAYALPANTSDRAVACLAYSAWAPPIDPRSQAAKRAIQRAIDDEVAAGFKTRQQIDDEFYEIGAMALNHEPRGEIAENWAACRDSFAPSV